ncbi:MAG: hypothetical protein LBH25_15140 [Fibromonadaceae bacterium]|jgi:uncharacterized protein (TIGR02145 family)|nr:hypothetical protein [Fibromonadaceae bacterium]
MNNHITRKGVLHTPIVLTAIIIAITLTFTLAGCGPNAQAIFRPPDPSEAHKNEPIFEHKKGSFTDQRDNKTYQTVEIGTQTWMAENLSYNTDGSKCYSNNESDCEKYGRQYDWLTAVQLPSKCQGLKFKPDFNPDNKTHAQRDFDPDCAIRTPHKGICPDGWHVSSDNDWATLISFAGGTKAGTRLKTTSGWPITNGSDSYGFAALPGGSNNSVGSWWTTMHAYAPGSGDVSSQMQMRGGKYDYAIVDRKNYSISSFSSVRCVQD